MTKIDSIINHAIEGIDQTLNMLDSNEEYTKGYIAGALGAITEILGDLSSEDIEVDESYKSLESLRDFYDSY